MKTLGLIGGMSWESSLEYYRIINEAVKEKLGGLHSAKCIMLSLDLYEIEKLFQEDQWEEIAFRILEAAKKLEKSGAECLIICTNTVHNIADEIERKVKIPLLHIGDAVGRAIKDQNLKKVGLLGTRFTMEKEFYRRRLKEKYGIEVVVPDKPVRKLVDDYVFKELCLGIIKESTRNSLKNIMAGLVSCEAEGIVLGCTELPLIIRPSDSPVPVFDTLDLHARYAVEFCLNEK